jgi:hypothetical protein
MTDLAQQIRDRLDGIGPASFTFEYPAGWTDEQREQFNAEFKATKTAVPPAFLEPVEPLLPEEIERWQKAFDESLPEGARVHPIRILPPGPRFYPGFEQMRDAILAMVDYTQPGDVFPSEGDSRDHAEKAIDAEVEAQLARVRELIAEKLGVEVDDG